MHLRFESKFYMNKIAYKFVRALKIDASTLNEIVMMIIIIIDHIKMHAFYEAFSSSFVKDN
jgi:hypothetical protein